MLHSYAIDHRRSNELALVRITIHLFEHARDINHVHPLWRLPVPSSIFRCYCGGADDANLLDRVAADEPFSRISSVSVMDVLSVTVSESFLRI